MYQMPKSYQTRNLNISTSPEIFDAHIEDMILIGQHLLQSCENLDVVTFSEQAGYVLLGGCYPNNGYECMRVFINLDWSNAKEAVEEFIKTWNKDGADSWNSFIDEGNKYGWE